MSLERFLVIIIMAAVTISASMIARSYAESKKISLPPSNLAAIVAAITLVLLILAVKFLHSIGLYPD
jgi:K+-transporting ATPase A subunit